ncbi:GH25 family lysozyme [Companilactobacillus nantensis]|uniref:Lyzozyme M1 (1,4-beta-N-acetylmuramidase) n=1 Tax=Companilactobacillus nantensis DSM 16982 TaxID=1423774 RepID=A0A0R1WQF2_9LACO|nr:GH25 family lysozyme [Companilactobacillus nantensis]KRM18404.1 Lyzozyme M1 (1,4-beta-N-acetylmuramidase) [Companilactobacillus nantensis DSM 16982]GEO62972.1 hypothetical protein LNA01_01550 [Companilactobacillus nantensis]
MVLKKWVIAAVTTVLSVVTVFFCASNVDAARMDMVDVSNYNGNMSVANFQDMHDNYGVKAAVTKISEGTTFKDAYAANDIKTAQAAGLYINGYHYAHYSTVAQAIAEADFAAQTAKADGLPAGAVLITDVESSEQAALSVSQNNANNAAFINEVAKYGYRSDIYTMGSWLNYKMNIDKGWLAAYPYNATDMYEYSWAHGWQWTSTYNFNGSYGNFDVSQLYDNFFTSYQAPQGITAGNTDTTVKPDTTTNNSVTDSSTMSVIKVRNSASDFINLMALQADGSMKVVTNRGLANDSSWKTDQTRTVDGVTYHRVATNEWVSAQYVIG